MQKLLSVLVAVFLVLPMGAQAYGKKPVGRTSIKKVESTTGVFMEVQHLWLPGKWDVKTEPSTLTFTRPAGDGKKAASVALFRVPREQCAYGVIRQRALKAWGGASLDQSQGRIEVLKFGSIKFMGYTWVEPPGARHWCIGQDLQGAVEMTAPDTKDEKELIQFIKSDLLLQLALRKGRSVLPWPIASEKAATDPMK